MNDRHQAALLLAILREDWPAASRLAARRGPDAERFAALARQCDVHPWVHTLLEREERFELVAPQARQQLEAWRHKVRNDNLLLLARTEQALDLLLAAGIRPVALKGLDVLHRFYDGFDQRSMDDVDLLVHPDQVERTFEVLQEAGWKLPDEPERTHWLRSSFEMPLTSPGPVTVGFEVHWSLGQEKRYGMDVEPLLAAALPLDVAGRSILRLEEHDAVAHLLLHHLQHYFDRRMKWCLDLNRYVRQPGFDWQAVAERLEAWHGRAAAGLALLHQAKLFPHSVDERARRLIPAAWWRRALTLPLRSSHPLDLFRGTRRRRVQLYLASVALEHPWQLPAYLLHRARRDRD